MFRMMEDKRISNKIVSSLLLLMLAWLMPLTTLAQNHWVPQSATYEDNMTLTGVIMINGEEQHSTALEVGAFCGEECRGSMRPVLFPPTQQYVVQMTIYGVAGDQITFKLYDHDLGEELNLQSPDAITFGSTGLGSLMNPYVLGFMPIVTISVTANPEEGGTLSGMGFYALGSTCTLVATPNVGYSFMYWTEDGNEVSTDANYSFIVTTDRNLVAHFTLPLTITAISNPVEGGMVAGMGEYDYNTSCTLTATANEGFTFSNWTKDGTVVSAAATFSFIVTESSTYVANFTDANGTGVLNGVFSIGENSHYNFSQGNLQYQASTNTWRFATNQWDCMGNDNTNISQTYSGWVDLFGWGTSGYNHGAVCYQPWSISNSYSDYYAYGVATYNLYDQTGQADWGYNAIANGGNTENGGWRTLTQSEWNYVFNTRNTESGIRYAKAQVNNVNGIILLPDDWSANTFTLNNTNTSNASFSSNNISASQWATLENAGAVFLPAAGYRDGTSVYHAGFYGNYWSASYSGFYGARYMRFGGSLNPDDSTDRNNGFSVRLVRHAENYSYEINAIPNPIDCGVVTGSGTYEEGVTCTLVATANEGYTFTNWTENGEVVSTEATYSFIVSGDRTLVANFSLLQFDITVSALPDEGGSVTGGGTYQYGQSCTLTAMANEGYAFANWKENGEVVSTDATYSFAVTGDRELVANFAMQSYSISASANPSAGGSVSGAGSYDHGSTCTLTATANEGYSFTNWTENGEVISSEASFSFTVTGERELVANFALQSYTISTSTNPSEGGSVTGSGTYGYGSACTVTATASEGYTFQRWTENGEVVSTEATYSFTVTGDRELVANFAHANGAGTLSGVFSVGENSHVNFSQGNLQYQASTNTWRFAENQWDYVGADNANISETYDGWIDLFGWGTSGYNHGAIGYQPWTISQDNGEYLAYGDGETNLNDQSGQADWGYNAISNGGNQENNGWRTMTQPEWDYLINGRTTASGIRYAKAIVNEVQGIILLPDDWSASIFELSNTNEPHASFNGNEIDLSQWEILENAGAVFLPSAGERISTSINYAGNSGYYWSATRTDVEGAFFTFFYWDYVGTDYGLLYDRSKGRSVRLVKDDQSNQKLSFINDDFNDGEINAGYWTATGPNVYEEEGMIKIQQNVTDNDVRLTSGYISIPGSGKILIDRKFLVHRANNYFSGGYYIAFNGDEQNYIRIAYWHEAYIGKYGIYIDAQLNGITTEIRLCDAVFDTWLNEAVLIDLASGTLAYCVDNNLVATNEIPGLSDMPQSYFHVWFYPYGWWTGHYQNMDFIKINVTEPSCHITVSSSLDEGGAVTGAGNYNYGDVCTLTAVPNDGYEFYYWSENGDVFSTEANASFIVTSSHDLVGVFGLPLNVTATASPSEGGTVYGAGEYNYGSTCTLTAAANEGYIFMNWTENGNVVSFEAAYSFTVTRDKNLAANFVRILYSISDDFNDGQINTEYWFCSGSDVYETDGFMKLEQNTTDDKIYLMSAPLSLPHDNRLIIDRKFMVHRSDSWRWGDYCENTIIFNGNEDSFVGVRYYNDIAGFGGAKNGTYIVTQLNGEYTETCLCEARFDTWLMECLVINFTNGSLDYYLNNSLISSIEVPALTEEQFTYYEMKFSPFGWYTGHYHYMDYININANVSNRMIVVSTNLNEAGVITGAGEHEYGSVCTLTATPNEGYEFQYWTENGETISTDPSYSFLVTADRSLVAHFIPTRQTFNLSAGWSWLSTYVEQDGIDGLSMLEEGLAANGIMVKSQYDGFVSYNAGSWMGSLEGITNEKMYLVNTSIPADVVITGPAASLSEHPITLNPNWNWISYPSPFERDINEALANLNATEGDVLKSQSCFAIYNNIYGWYGSLNTMTPGMGYMYQSHNIEDVTFVYSEGMSRSLKRNADIGNNHWVHTIEAYPQNMSMIVVVELNGEEVGGERYELAVFSGEECRGSVRLVYVEPLHRHVAFLSVMGEEVVDLSLALYDTQTGKAYFNPTDGLRFVANAVLGTPDSPYVARFGGMGVVENDAESIAFYPNPVRAGQLFQIEMPVECPGVRVSIVNALGTVVSTTDLYAHPATLRAPAVAGVYLLRMVTNKGVAYCRKLVVKN